MFVRVLVNVMRNVTVVMVKEQLLTVLQLNDTLSSGSVLLAEVSSHHIHRVLVSCFQCFVLYYNPPPNCGPALLHKELLEVQKHHLSNKR